MGQEDGIRDYFSKVFEGNSHNLFESLTEMLMLSFYKCSRNLLSHTRLSTPLETGSSDLCLIPGSSRLGQEFVISVVQRTQMSLSSIHVGSPNLTEVFIRDV